VPAVAVKRREQVLFVLIGCKMRVDGISSFLKKDLINTVILELIIIRQYFKCKGEILKYLKD